MVKVSCNDGYRTATKPLPSGQFRITWTASSPEGSQNSHVVHPTTLPTIPPIQNTSGANSSHIWIPQGINVSLTVSKACYCGFVIYRYLLAVLDIFIKLQGTKVLENREVRFQLTDITGGAPQRQALSSVLKYTGAHSSPEWMDIEPGSLSSFNDFTRGLKSNR